MTNGWCTVIGGNAVPSSLTAFMVIVSGCRRFTGHNRVVVRPGHWILCTHLPFKNSCAWTKTKIWQLDAIAVVVHRVNNNILSTCTYLERVYGVGLRRFPRQNHTVRSDLSDHVQTNRVFRSNQAQVFPVVTLKTKTSLHTRFLLNHTSEMSFFISVKKILSLERHETGKHLCCCRVPSFFGYCVDWYKKY